MMTKALVLSGGGPVGVAWESALLAGLAEAGVDASQADFILGTSAGAFVGAQLAMGRSPATIAAPFLGPQPGPSSPAQLLKAQPDLSILFAKMQELLTGGRPPHEVFAEVGAWALKAETPTEADFIASFGRWLSEVPENAWPKRDYACTAVDTADGSFVVWDKDSKVGLARAVASSCSVPGVYPPVTIHGRRYMDGGLRSVTNADLAKGYDMVVVVTLSVESPVARAELWRRRLEKELETLRSGGSQVELIAPDAASLQAFGPNLMDYRRRPAAAEAGNRQGKQEAARIREAWNQRQWKSASNE